jgi:pyridoxal phosphate enzyme (YggS family)
MPAAGGYRVDGGGAIMPAAREKQKELCVAKRSPLAEKLDEVKQRIATAAIRARREPGEITLVAVTKTAGLEQIREAMQLGVADLGESRVQQLAQRAAQVNESLQRRQTFGEGGASVTASGAPATPPPVARWHMIGHLQRNKAKQLVPLVSLIHSVDSLRLAEELDIIAEKAKKRCSVLLQVNASEEPQKAGVAVGAAVHLAEQIASMPGLQLGGLMTMAAFDAPEAQVRQTFARTRELFEEIRWQKIGGGSVRHLSMGMSTDFELAIAEGATMVRIGSLLFGGKVMDHEDAEE